MPKSHIGESFIVASFSGSEKVYGQEGEGSIKIFQQINFFCLTVPKISVGETFTVALNSVTDMVWIRGKGEVKIFLRKSFVSRCRKNLVGQSFFVALISGIAKVWIRRREEYPDFLSRKFSSRSAENFRTVILCCINFGYRKSLDKRWGGGANIKIFRRKLFVSQC